MKLEMSLKKNVVGGLKFWKYFRARFAEARPLGYPAWSYRHMVPFVIFFKPFGVPCNFAFFGAVRRVVSGTSNAALAIEHRGVTPHKVFCGRPPQAGRAEHFLCELAQPVRFLCEMASEASAREVLASETSDFLRIFVLGVGFCERRVGHFW